MEHQISEIMKLSLENIRDLIDVNVIVGKEILVDKGVIIPISEVKCCFAGGGIDQKKFRDDKNPFGGGTMANLTLKPVAFLVCTDEVKLLHVDEADHNFEKIVDFISKTIDNIQNKKKEM